MLYVLNDLFHHAIVRRGETEVGSFWDAQLPGLVAEAASFEKAPRHKKKVEDLIIIWAEKKYFSDDLLSKLGDAASKGAAGSITMADASTSLKLAKDAPFLLPSQHGDPSTPWHDLPATTWLPHLTPNSTKAMMTSLIRPIQLVAGPADAGLADAVRGLLSDVERLFSKDKKLGGGGNARADADADADVDVNELGERVVLDEVTGEVVGGETYYGWSRQFCEKMKQRKRRPAGGEARRGRSRSRSSSRSPSRSSRGSPSPRGFKRRRLSSHSRSDHSRSPVRRHRSSLSRSRSRSPRRDHGPYRHRPSLSPPRSPPHPMSRPYHNSQPPQYNPPALAPSFPPIPPPPAGYRGPWPPPPPPPPPPAASMGGPQAWFPNPGMMPQMPGWPAGAPPPPPPPQSGHYGSRGYGGYGGRGRGGYDRDRGRGR